MWPSLPRSALLSLALLLVAGRATADTSPRRLIEALLQPDHIERATLSPDGRHLAYVEHDGPVNAIKVRNVDPPDRVTTIFADLAARKGFFHSTLIAPIEVLHLGWAPTGSLVYGLDRPAPRGEFGEEFHVVDADGAHDRTLVRSSDLTVNYAVGDGMLIIPRHAHVIGFDPRQRGSLLIEAIGNRLVDTESYRIDLATGARTRIAGTDAQSPVLYDRAGRPRIRETPRVLFHGPPTLASRRYFEYRGVSGSDWRRLDDLGAMHFSENDEDVYLPRSFPLGFGSDPNVLYLASDVGRDTFAMFALDLTTGQRTELASEVTDLDPALPPAPEPSMKMLMIRASGRRGGAVIDDRGAVSDASARGPLVFDAGGKLVGIRIAGDRPHTRWFDAGLAALQARADARFPDRNVRIINWDVARTRLLLLVTGTSDPGRYLVFEVGPPPEFTEMLRCNAVRAAAVAPSELFSFRTAAGNLLHGVVTVPKHPRLNPPPLIVLCPDVPGGAQCIAALDPEAQALAALGYMVVRVAYRGTAGFGREHRDAIKAGLDRIPLADIHATIDWLAIHHPFNRPRVALVGHGIGGFIAVRALELYPGEFRAAVSIDGAISPANWVIDDPVESPFRHLGIPSEASAQRRAFFWPELTQLETLAPARHLTQLRGSVMLVQSKDDAEAVSAAHRFRTALQDHAGDVECLDTAAIDEHGVPTAKVLLQIGAFLNATVYDYRVDIGKEREVK